MAESVGHGHQRPEEQGWLARIQLPGEGNDPRHALERTVLPSYLLRCRWYAAKDAGRPEVEILDLVAFPPPVEEAVLAVLRVTPPGREPQRYLLPLMVATSDAASERRPVAEIRRHGWPAVLIDALDDERFARGLLALLTQSRGENGIGILGRRTAAFAEQAEALGAAAPCRSAAEQSNTTIRYGDTAVLKLFRRLEPGIHPELEIGRHLTEVARFANTPPLLGWLELRAGEADGAVLAVLQRLVPNAADGWDHVLGRLRQVREGALGDEDLLALARRLGQRTAELHRAFAAASDDPALAPEPVDAGVLRAWGEGARAMAERALGALAQAAPGLAPAVREEAERLLARRDEVLRSVDALLPERIEAVRTRLHGDYHLGQVLVADGDVHIIDFEGEPMRPLEERRGKHSPLRDVAGMLRSFAYAAATIARELGDGRLDAWADAMAEAFLGAYRDAVGDCPSIPRDRGQAEQLLRLFLLEKALYEVGYELANRPDWLGIPVAGVLALLARAPEPTALDRLAERMGIVPGYGSATGETVRTSAATKRALLAAMGVEAPDEDTAQARLDELERAELAQPLPPVVVVREDRLPAGIWLALTAGTGEVRWTLREEQGAERDGSVAFASLELERSCRNEGAEIEVRTLKLPGPIPPGYHRLRVEAGERRGETSLIVAPPRCWLPETVAQGGRIWGLSAQLYTLRSAPDWGMGDFGDLANLLALAASRGAAVVGLNPLHAMFLDRPEHASPYSPASRLLLNPLYIDVTAIPELMACEPALATIASKDFQKRKDKLRGKRRVDHAGVMRLKLPLLEAIHATFKESATPERQAAFAAFREELGESLERFCLFQALRERFAGEDPAMAAWQAWPEPLRDPTSPEARHFREEHRARVEFLVWLQWIADTQLAAAQKRARESGMPVGIYRDLAVGADASGAETWANPGTVVATAQVGAPPDLFNPAGQNWGLPPFHPQRLRAEGYRSFVDLVRANMRHAGGLRIDHVMALQQLYWIPAGSPASEGGYVAYPLDDLLGVLALESHRHSCLVVGEDLGTVPPGFRERMEENAILSYRVVFFEWTKDGSFIGPDAYPYLALSTIGSHDLATLRGWWEGHDIELKQRCGQYPDEQEALAQRERRASDRRHLVDAIRASGFSLPTSLDDASPWSDAIGSAVHAFLARTRSAIAMVQLDDLTNELEQVNLPGTTDEYPNWRRKLSLTLEELADDERACTLMSVMSAVRSGSAAGD